MLSAAFTNHHKYENDEYENDECGNWEPIGCRKLAKKAGTSRGSATRFFMEHFGGHKEYTFACNGKGLKLIKVLRKLNEDPSRESFGPDLNNFEIEDDGDGGRVCPKSRKTPADGADDGK